MQVLPAGAVKHAPRGHLLRPRRPRRLEEGQGRRRRQQGRGRRRRRPAAAAAKDNGSGGHFWICPKGPLLLLLLPQ